MKKIFSYVLPFLLIAFLMGCAPRFPMVESYYVTPAKWDRIPDLFALSPDGEYATYPDVGFIQLTTGEESRPHADYKNLNFEGYMGSDGLEAWSPDGRYFTVSTLYDDRTPGANRDPLYIFDNRERTAKKLPDTARLGVWWSPFNTEHFMAQYFYNNEYAGLGIFDTQGSLISLVNEEVDFRNETELRGNGNDLWSKALDRPVASMQTFVSKSFLPTNPPFPTPPVERSGLVIGSIYIDSFAYPMDYEKPKYRFPIMEDTPLNGNVGFIFDPTGKYVLLAQWQCADANFTHCTNDSVMNISNVTDTVFTLLDWRTGEKQEIFRLSKIGDGYVAGSAPVAWSADGSTIIIGRHNSQSVVLKIKYP